MLLCFMNSSSLQLCFKCRTVFKTLGNMPLDFMCAALTVCSPRMLEIAIRSKWMKMTGTIRGAGGKPRNSLFFRKRVCTLATTPFESKENYI